MPVTARALAVSWVLAICATLPVYQSVIKGLFFLFFFFQSLLDSPLDVSMQNLTLELTPSFPWTC